MTILDIISILDKKPEEVKSIFRSYAIQPKDEYVLHCFVRGSGVLRIGREKYSIKDSVKFLTFPGEGVAINIFSHSKPVTYYGFSFSLSDANSETASFMLENLKQPRLFTLNKNTRPLLDELTYKFENGNTHSLKSAEHQLLSLLYSLPERKTSETLAPETIEYIEYACELMMKNVYEPTKLSGICHKLNVTESHFIRVFKLHMGISPMKYYTQLKIQEAAKLLNETDIPIARIAEKLNFSNESHFNRTFKQYLSITPGQYRHNYIKTLEARQKKSEQELEEAYNLLQKIIDATPDLIFYKDTNGILMGCNDAFSEIVGLPKERIIGFSDFEIHPADMAQFFTERDQVIFQNDHPYKNEEWMKYPNGEKRRFEVYKAPFHDANGNIIGLLGISRDITEREENKLKMEKAKQEEQIANEQKTQFLLTMADEYLTSISRIQQYIMKSNAARTIQSSGAPFNKLLFECDYLSVLTKDIIDFIKYQSGEESVQVRGFNLLSFLNRLRYSIQKNLKLSSSVSVRIHSEVPKIVFGDELRLQHLIVHLVNTALRNSEGGNIVITCTHDGNTAAFRLEIDGVNFGERKQESILKAVNSKTENSFFKKGVDLSMLIAHRITAAMEGDLKVSFQKPGALFYTVSINLPSDVESLDLYYTPKNLVTTSSQSKKERP
jgi:PAS domain S-box-containing protein